MTEGEMGTWSHCGSRKPHAAHRHTIVFNEGPYLDILCLGTPVVDYLTDPTIVEKLTKHMTNADLRETK